MTFRTFTTNEVLTATNLMTYAQKVDGLPLGFFTKSGTQSIPTSGTAAAVTWDTESLDTDAAHDTVTNNSRYTAKTAGYYRCYAQVEWAGNATGTRDIEFRVNGVATSYLKAHSGSSPASNNCTATSGVLPVRLAVNDYIEVFVTQTSGGALLVNITAGEHFWCVEYISN